LLPVLLAAALPLYNFHQDYYGVFFKRSDWRGVVPNERYLKYEAVVQRPQAVRSLLFGSSKAANIPFYRSLGAGAYNFAYSEGLPRDHLQVLEKLVDELPSLERVYIAVDDMSYLLDPTPHAGDYLRRQHPAVAGEPIVWFKLGYLFRALSNTDNLYFFGDRQERPDVVYEWHTSGRSLCPDCDRDIDADPEAHRTQAFFNFPYSPPERYGIDRLAADLRALRALLESRGVELLLFLQPSFANNFRWHNLAMLEELKREMAAVAPFYDFLVHDPRLVDPVNFYDVVHFRPPIGQDIMDVLTGKTRAVAGDFGFLADTETVDEHNAGVRAALLDEWVPRNRYAQDRDFARWSAAAGHPRSPLPSADADRIAGLPRTAVDCRLDSVMRRRYTGGPVRVAREEANMLEFSGWSSLGAGGKSGYLELTSEFPLGAHAVYAIAAGLERRDVARARGADLLLSGFRGNVDISGLERGNYRVALLFGESGGEWFACGNDIRLVVF
jgi:hypothetical protein